MKIIYSIIIFILATFVLLGANTIVESFTAKSGSSSIVISWRTGDEGSITSFEIERATTNKIFKYISTVDAKGKASDYNYEDKDFFKTSQNDKETQVKTTYIYRLKINKSDNTSFYSDETYAVHDVSGFKRTWGMIKEMFR